MFYITDNNGNHIIDGDGNKMTYSYLKSDISIEPHREMIHIDDDGHINTENRHIVINDGVNPNHAVSKGQLDSTKTQIINMIPYYPDINYPNIIPIIPHMIPIYTNKSTYRIATDSGDGFFCSKPVSAEPALLGTCGNWLWRDPLDLNNPQILWVPKNADIL